MTNEPISAMKGKYKRNSFLKRNPALSKEEFRAHYELRHGPLAASLAGFRKFSLRYIQNYVEDLADGVEPPFDGITMTTQVPRDDYSKGFFDEPDYLRIKQDETYLFDLSRTVSVLGEETFTLGQAAGDAKAVLLLSDESGDSEAIALFAAGLHGLTHAVASRLETATASALGFGGTTLAYDYMLEAWFETSSLRERCFDEARARKARTRVICLPVREIMIFGPEKPWIETAGN